ncbi:ABC transporter substrate-binding protein [Nocardia brasiliensis]|uniref:ABC transporter substrate-binding protein n=1 Tax=Nocardia brasiliensis TaxID=37326 RepID=UPI003D8E9DCC
MTRPRLLATLLAAVVPFAACATAAPPGPGPAAETVTVATANGEATVPVTETGILALDYQTALNLLTLGVVPAHAGKYAYATDPFVAAAYSILEQAGVELIEPGNAELIATAAPELIVGLPRTGSDEIVPKLGAIAPVVLLPELPLLADELETLGAVTGHREQARAVTRRLDTAEHELAQRIRDSEFAGASVSALSACGADSYCRYGNARGFGPILTALGLTRPPSQASKGNQWGYERVSPEKLDEQAAQIVIAFVGSISAGAISPLRNPLLDTSAAVTGEVDFSAWFGVGPLNHLWVLNDLAAILFGTGRVATESDGPALWARLTRDGP